MFLWQCRKKKTSKKMIMPKITISKKRRYDLFIFQTTEKNRVLNIHSMCNCSDHLFSINYSYGLTLLFLGYYRKLWRICDLICIYYLSVENYPCYLWLEIFGKLRICCWVWKTFVVKILVSYLWLFRLKSKPQFCKKIIHISCKVKVCYIWLFRV